MMPNPNWIVKLTRVRPLLARVALAGACAVLAPCAWAHKASDAYLRVSDAPASSEAAVAGGKVGLAVSVALKDVDAALEQLDADGDRQLTWGEIRQSAPAIAQWVGQGMQWHCGGASVTANWRFEALEQRTDGRYARLAGVLDCAPAEVLALRYGLMQGIDPTHRLLVGGTLSGQPLAAVLAPDGRASADLRAAASSTATTVPEVGAQEAGAVRGGIATMLHFVAEGVHHILEGYDHLAFLLALLLPISLTWQRPLAGTAPPAATTSSVAWIPLAGLKALLITVTCFTVGHSITLALAGLGWVTVSGNWVEPAIAISIGISALLNLFPVRGLRSSWLALGFGLIHGLGFSGVLVEAGVPGTLLVWALAGFNLGVEAGQLLLVAVWCAVSVVLGRWALYRLVVLRGGSVALLMLSVYWTVQRVAVTA